VTRGTRPARPTGTHRLADLAWVGVPRRVLKVSTLAGAALADGAYLRAWPAFAAAAPPGALLLGFALGAGHTEELYTYSLLVMGLLGILSGLGGALGTWALAGFVVGDLLLARRGEWSRLTPGLGADGLRATAALVLTYVLLAGLLMLVPVVANAVRLATRTALTRSARPSLLWQGRLAGASLVLTQTLLAFCWTQSTPFLVRPVWSFFGTSPDVPAINPLQQQGWVVALAIGAAAVGRLVLEARAAEVLDPLEMPGLAGGLRPALPWQVVVAGRTAFTTFLLSGLVGTWWGALLTAAALAGVFTLHVRVLPGLGGYVRAVTRVPLPVRVAVAVVAAWVAGSTIVQSAVDRGGSSFVSLVVATLVSLLVVAVLLPERPRATTGPRRPAEPAEPVRRPS
jgi:hypothetical protein